MTYRQLHNYFAGLGSGHPDISFFRTGDYAKIIQAEKHIISYPCMWMESPSFGFKGDKDTKKKAWYISFLIIAKSEDVEDADIEANIDQAERIMLEVVSKIIHDSINNPALKIEIDLSAINIDLVYSAGGDHSQGWRCEMEIESKSGITCDMSIWN